MLSVIPVALVFLITWTAMAAQSGIMTKEELRQQLDDPQIVVLDVRKGGDWKSSEFKIKGAERVNPKKFKEWASKYPKDKTLVLYCA